MNGFWGLGAANSMTAPKREMGEWQARDSKDEKGKMGRGAGVWEKTRKIHGFRRRDLLGPKMQVYDKK
jgi:hypothetical protein